MRYKYYLSARRGFFEFVDETWLFPKFAFHRFDFLISLAYRRVVVRKNKRVIARSAIYQGV